MDGSLQRVWSQSPPRWQLSACCRTSRCVQCRHEANAGSMQRVIRSHSLRPARILPFRYFGCSPRRSLRVRQPHIRQILIARSRCVASSGQGGYPLDRLDRCCSGGGGLPRRFPRVGLSRDGERRPFRAAGVYLQAAPLANDRLWRITSRARRSTYAAENLCTATGAAQAPR
jgi:hypothetical protein